MSGRVLSTEQAKSSIQQVQAIVNGGLTEQIAQLDAQGKTLSNPDVWDGPLAQQFRDQIWPETKSALDKAKVELDDLREQLQRISQNIMTAGGGACRPSAAPVDGGQQRAQQRCGAEVAELGPEELVAHE